MIIIGLDEQHKYGVSATSARWNPQEHYKLHDPLCIVKCIYEENKS